MFFSFVELPASSLSLTLLWSKPLSVNPGTAAGPPAGLPAQDMHGPACLPKHGLRSSPESPAPRVCLAPSASLPVGPGSSPAVQILLDLSGWKAWVHRRNLLHSVLGLSLLSTAPGGHLLHLHSRAASRVCLLGL